jgi:AraC-like DNA-binding protein
MTISISQPVYDQLYDEMIEVEPTRHPDPQDKQDFMGRFPPELGEGSWRTIALRDGLEVTLGSLQMHDHLLTSHPAFETDWLELHLHLSGFHELGGNGIGAGQYGLYGSGLLPQMPLDTSDQQAFWEVNVWMRADVLRSFMGDADGELPTALQLWVRPVEERGYRRFGTATPAMRLAARQMLRCGLQGLPKRMFLEGKALELMGLAAATELDQYGSALPITQPDVLDRVHHARDILQQRLDQPPSLGELARLVGLNDCTLKQQFRQVFGTTVFGYLHDYRMRQAQQMLETGAWKVEEVAGMTGYGDMSAFGRAFRKRFGMRPRDCLRKFSV